MNEGEIYKRIVTLEELFKTVRIVGGDQIDVQGNFASGFAVNVVKNPTPKPTPTPAVTSSAEVTFNDAGTPEIIDVAFVTPWSAI